MSGGAGAAEAAGARPDRSQMSLWNPSDFPGREIKSAQDFPADFTVTNRKTVAVRFCRFRLGFDKLPSVA